MRKLFTRIWGEIRQHPIIVVGVILTAILVYFAWRNSSGGGGTTTDPTQPIPVPDPILPPPPPVNPIPILPLPPVGGSGGSGTGSGGSGGGGGPAPWNNQYPNATDSQSDPSYGSGPPPTYPGHYTDASSDPTYGNNAAANRQRQPAIGTGSRLPINSALAASQLAHRGGTFHPQMTHTPAPRPSLTIMRMQKQRGGGN